MKRKKTINKELYPTKWKEFVEKYGEKKAFDCYWGFLRSFCEEKYILKYGEVEGKKRYIEKRKNTYKGVSLEGCIEKHGEKKGAEVYRKWKKEIRQDKNAFIERYGEQEGENRFNVFKKKCRDNLKKCEKTRSYTTQLEYWIKKYNGDKKEAIKKLKDRQTTGTLKKFIKKYGKVEGAKKYQEVNKKKVNNLQSFIERYGDIKGPQKYSQMIDNLKYAASKQRYIKKYGIELGEKKYRENICKKTNHLYKNRQSIVGLEFCERINDVFAEKYEKIYYGEKEYKFFIWEEGVTIAIVDFYIKDINLVIEFYGDFWHRNPKKFKDEESKRIREKDKKRIRLIKNKFGCNVIIVWENDYVKEKDNTLKNTIKQIRKMEKNG